jgi:hypothetical protein
MEGRLERGRERRGAASGQSQCRDRSVLCEFALGESEETAPVDVLDKRAERVGEPACLAGEQRRRDVQGGGTGASILWEHRRRERPSRELGKLLRQYAEHAFVLVQQGRRALVSRVSEEVSQRPQTSQRSRSPPRSDPVTRGDASKAALMPPALVPDNTSTSTTMSSRSMSSV